MAKKKAKQDAAREKEWGASLAESSPKNREQDEKDRRLWSALERKSWGDALDELKLGANINAQGATEEGCKEWSSPLVWASIMGEEGLLCWLIEHGAWLECDLDPDQDGNVALHYAAEHGNVSCVKALLKAGATAGAKNYVGEAPIHLAAQGQWECVSALAQAGAKVDQLDDAMETPLHKAALYGDLKACMELLGLGALSDIKNTNGETPMALARNENRRWYMVTMEQRELCALAIEARIESVELSSHLPATAPMAPRAPKKSL